MYSSFYTAGAGASAHQSKLNVISNNFANINTTAFKSRSTAFSDLMYSDYTVGPEGLTQEGNGTKVGHVSINTRVPGSPMETGEQLDFMINGDGYFAVSTLDSEEPLYTRDGRFMVSNIEDTLYLTNSSGMVVLNEDGEAIEVTEDLDLDGELPIGVFNFPYRDSLVADGYNNFRATEEAGEVETVENPNILRGVLEASNVNMATEMSRVIEAQRAFALSLKMIQTSDEVEQEVNSLRRG